MDNIAKEGDTITKTKISFLKFQHVDVVGLKRGTS